jgi:hypothetical protein
MAFTQEQLTSLADACASAFPHGAAPAHALVTPDMAPALQWVARAVADAPLAHMLAQVRSAHWHTHARGNVVEPPEDVVPAPATCPFHCESLWEHSCGVMVVALQRALALGYPANLCALAALTGLLHDVGKVMTVTLLRKKTTAYPMHCCVAAGALLQVAPPDGVTDGDWQALARAVAVHMCGYHRLDWDAPSATSLWRLRLLQGEDARTKQLLCALRPGDISATVPVPGKEEDPWPSQLAFEAALLAVAQFDGAALRAAQQLRGTLFLVGGDPAGVRVGDEALLDYLAARGCQVVHDQASPLAAVDAAMAQDRAAVLWGDTVYSSKVKDVLPAAARAALIVAIDCVPAGTGLDWLPRRALGRPDARIGLQFFLRPRAAHSVDPVNSLAPHVRIQATGACTRALAHWLACLFQ